MRDALKVARCGDFCVGYVLAKHYGFTEEELDFMINYDIKYRMGPSGGQSEDE